jgi:2-polyprenyl-3-methyl-5-hydroxy-6-metoxy-1,4-benzoquinol methylase
MTAQSINAQVQKQLQSLLSQTTSDHGAEQVQLNNALRLLSKWRSVLIQNTLLQQQGTIVMQGPLQGLDFLPQSAEGCHIAKLLGCYEQPLQPFIEQAIQKQYATVLNIGCAEGYYAVGMALRMPHTRVLAHDLNPKAQEVCTALAVKNKVADRVEVAGLFTPADFAAYTAQDVLLMCDIEGAERELLDPAAYPALQSMDIIVESHECLIPGITQLLIDRFKATHDITLVQDDGQRQLVKAPAWFNNLAHLDQLLATWEWRSGPTPWLVMKPKSAV